MLRSLLYSLDARLNYWTGKRKFRNIGRKVHIICPLRITGHGNISLGNNVIINYKTWLAAHPLTGMPDCLLEIGDGSVIGNFNHIYATHSVRIGKHVLTADKVYISDNLHEYRDIQVPVMHQPVIQNNTVSIGDGSWLGENVCILGARIGKQCVIGANSVVMSDIPDYCVAVGSPARIVKRYCLEDNTWKKTTPDGAFIA